MKLENYPTPRIHLNGTGKSTLISDYSNALESLNKAIENFSKVEFHARDYYVISNSAFNEAKSARQEVYQKLLDTKKYLNNHIESLMG